MTQIFISYRRVDSQANTDRIYSQLVRAFGKKAIFKDVDNIPLGEDFPSYLTRILNESDVVLVIIGRNWSNVTDDYGNLRLVNPHDFVRLEVEMALYAPNIRVIPVMVNDSQMPNVSDLPESIRALLRLNAISVRNDPDFENDIKRLIRNLKRLGIQRKQSYAGILLMIVLVSIIFLATLLGINLLPDNLGNTTTRHTNINTSQTTLTDSLTETQGTGETATRIANINATVTTRASVPTSTLAPTTTDIPINTPRPESTNTTVPITPDIVTIENLIFVRDGVGIHPNMPADWQHVYISVDVYIPKSLTQGNNRYLVGISQFYIDGEPVTPNYTPIEHNSGSNTDQIAFACTPTITGETFTSLEISISSPDDSSFFYKQQLPFNYTCP